MPDAAPRALPQADSGLATSWPALDRLLDGGWPLGELTEITGHGRASLALAAVRQAQAAGQPAAWVDGSASFCPATAGVDLGALTLVRPPRALPRRREGPRDAGRDASRR